MIIVNIYVVCTKKQETKWWKTKTIIYLRSSDSDIFTCYLIPCLWQDTLISSPATWSFVGDKIQSSDKDPPDPLLMTRYSDIFTCYLILCWWQDTVIIYLSPAFSAKKSRQNKKTTITFSAKGFVLAVWGGVKL